MITPLLDLPAVGKNLHDHPAASVAVRTANTESYGLSWRTVPRSALIAAQYLLLRSGPLASNVFEANGFMRSRPELDRPDLQIIFMPAHRNASGHWLPRGHGYGIIFVNVRPASRGSVTLKSADPHDKPAIDFNFLAAPHDLDVLVRGFEIARSILSAPSFAPLAGREISPGLKVRERGEIEAHIRRSLVTVHHACGTCRMGDVVDSSLRVKGIDALRVVDASVIPTVIAGNSNIPVTAVAERAADLITGETAMTDFAGMKIIVTGGAGSIGHATACVLAARGADILLVDINRDGLEQRRAAVAAFGTQVEVFHADVSRTDAVQGYVAAACKAFGRIDGLFNNAGTEGKVASIETYDEAEFDRLMAVNLRSIFLGMRHVIPVMLAPRRRCSGQHRIDRQ